MNKRVLSIVAALMLVLTSGCGAASGGQSQGTASGVVSTEPTPVTPVQSTQPVPSSPAQSSPSQKGPVQSSPAESSPSPSALPKPLAGQVTAARIIDDKSGWVGGAGWIARSEDNGATWNVQYWGDETIFQIFALNGQNAWAVAGKTQDISPGYNILYTNDGGKSWSKTGTVDANGFLHFNSVTAGYMANRRTADGGKTWSALPVPNNIVGDAYFHDGSIGWAVTEDKDKSTVSVERTGDGGKTWTTVMTRHLYDPWLTGALIRSAGADDAWVEIDGGVGMNQQSYSLFHTTDGGKTWLTVLANSTAGAGCAPGFDSEDNKENRNGGTKPGPLYVVDRKTAFLGGHTDPRDNPNVMGRTNDGGKTWVNNDTEYPGHGNQLLAMADAAHGWWICTDNEAPSVLYTTSDGGGHWTTAYTFGKT